MSYIEIFAFDKDGNSESYAEVRNAWGGSMAIWNVLGEKYCGHGASMFDLSKMKEIWNLVDNTKVPMNERIVLFTTLDKVLVKKEDLPKVIDAFRDFDGNDSLKEQADILEDIYNSCDEYIAVGWHQNSVSCEQWFDYNCLSGTEHFCLFDELEGLDESND